MIISEGGDIMYNLAGHINNYYGIRVATPLTVRELYFYSLLKKKEAKKMQNNGILIGVLLSIFTIVTFLFFPIKQPEGSTPTTYIQSGVVSDCKYNTYTSQYDVYVFTEDGNLWATHSYTPAQKNLILSLTMDTMGTKDFKDDQIKNWEIKEN
jgi:hypothetical protein